MTFEQQKYQQNNFLCFWLFSALTAFLRLNFMPMKVPKDRNQESPSNHFYLELSHTGVATFYLVPFPFFA